MEIRQASTDEAVAIVDDLWLPFAREMADLDDYNALAADTREAAIEHRREKLSHADYCVQIAVEDGTFVGFASAEVQASSPVFERGSNLGISEVYVRPTWRQQGIASALLDAIEVWGNEHEHETVSLTVNANNRAAKAFYEDGGFDTKRLTLVKSSR
jgi:GNAT superfamily N-acetyltransferase